MAIPWYPREEILYDEWAEREITRSWWHGFSWGALIGVAWMAAACVVDTWLRH